MQELEFECMREMFGDREYAEGDTRKMFPIDAVALVKSGALEPIGEEAKQVMDELIARAAIPNYGTIHAPAKDNAPRNKDAGDAPRNKGDGTSTLSAEARGAADGTGIADGPATGTGSGADGAGVGAPAPETPASAPTPTPTPSPTPAPSAPDKPKPPKATGGRNR